MRGLIVLVIFLTTMLALVSFFSIDACMDAGGAWSNWGFTCRGAYPEFVPQYQRVVPVFWLLVILLSAIPAYVIHKVLPHAAH